ncbi:Microprocessor complex subunit DGCR8 [Nymphon striatum]|nr:Microprocessor complex subunit DGCR8 [Nymphon striatum]
MENFVDTEDLVDDNQNELPPLPSSPPPIELIPPMPSQMSNLNEIESTHLDFDPGLGEQLSNGVNSDEDEVSDEMLQSDDDEEEPPTKVQKLNMSNMHRFNEKNNEDDNSSIKNMEFDVLDEVNDDALDDSKEYYSDSSNDYIDHDEIDAMLDESLKKNLGKPGSLRESDTLEAGDIKHEVMQKIVLKAINRDHFEFLPEGWIEVTHNSGMPVYLHKESRVCSFSPPYFLGRGSARKHEIPMSAIPCLHYVTMLKKQKADLLCKAETNGRLSFKDWLHFANHLFNIVISKSVKGENASSVPNVKVEGVDEIIKQTSLDQFDVRNYCENLFQFHSVTVRKFKSWASKRKHEKLLKQKQRPTLVNSFLFYAFLQFTPHKSKRNTYFFTCLFSTLKK